MKFTLNAVHWHLVRWMEANVEIAELAGRDNIYIFGEDLKTVIDLYEKSAYKISWLLRTKLSTIGRLFIISDAVPLQLATRNAWLGFTRNWSTKTGSWLFLTWKTTLSPKNVGAGWLRRPWWRLDQVIVNIAKAGFSYLTVADRSVQWKIQVLKLIISC